ncbi:MAG: response regulator transcription factor [Candidatus Bipolaricaulota bacterium]|nr:MAG: response regulator transcription factor [Candidatus Bipolaricaulota bacterium]
MPRILICEDDRDIARILSSYLKGEGFEAAVVEHGDAVVEAHDRLSPDIMLLDVRLPGMNGWEILERIRERASTPVIIVTALGRSEDVVRGLASGADDFVRKPFQLAEVRARIEAVLRRSHAPLEDAPLVVIDDSRKEVTIRGRLVRLSPKEYRLLALLASWRGHVFSDEEILARLWPGSTVASAEDVQKYVYLLRKKIEDDPADPRLVVTVRGFGYRLAA